ncbi:MAG TPA: ABC transporter permease, partial [Spirochaetia bacterium]|nr:ABC transporter permease [Spirochaetia bacterium]
MRVRASLFFGLRNFWSTEGGKRRNQLRGAIAGVALSLVPLVVVLEVANGMIEGITARYVEIGTFHLQIRSYVDLSDAEFQSALDKVNATPGVTEAFPVYSGLGLAYSSTGRTGVSVRALPPSLYANDEGFQKYLSFT